MNISNMATGLAGVGLTAAASLNTGAGDQARWGTRAVMAFASTVGTTLSLVQCFQEGRNVSAKTISTLTANASLLAYSCLQALAETDINVAYATTYSHTHCYREISADGELGEKICRVIQRN